MRQNGHVGNQSGNPRPAGWLLLVFALSIASMFSATAAGSAAAVPARQDPAANEARVRIVHGAPDAGPVSVYVDGAIAVSGITYPSVTEGFRLSAGERRVQIVRAGANIDAAVLDTTVDLPANATVIIATLSAETTLEALVAPLDLTPLDAGRARLRFVHGSFDAGTLDFAVTRGDTLFPQVSYGDATEYVDIESGTYDLELRATGSDVAALVLPSTVIEAGMVYDLYAVGRFTDATVTSLLVESVARTPTESGRAARLQTGECAAVGDGAVVADLTGLRATGDANNDQSSAAPVETSFTTVPTALEDILATDYLLAIGGTADTPAALVACGDLGGGLTDDGALVVGLREVNESGWSGIAVLAPNVADPTVTDISLFLAASLGTE